MYLLVEDKIRFETDIIQSKFLTKDNFKYLYIYLTFHHVTYPNERKFHERNVKLTKNQRNKQTSCKYSLVTLKSNWT